MRVVSSPLTTRWPAFAFVAFATLVLCREASAQERSGASKPSVSGASCTVITGAELVEMGGGATLTEALQGKIPGLQINVVNGMRGARTRIRFRGQRSAFGSHEPLIFIDGIRMTQPRGIGSSGTNPAIQYLDMVDVSDVLRIEVLRGPAGTTLYGTDASNGVIHVFTKLGNRMLSLATDPKRSCN